MAYVYFADIVRTCPLSLWSGEEGACHWCRAPLTGRRTAWCSIACEVEAQRLHHWGSARAAAVRRDLYTCVRCGAHGAGAWMHAPWAVPLEVNHIDPRRGQGYGAGCHNHPDNLETLCHPCHVAVTTAQRRSRARDPANASLFG